MTANELVLNDEQLNRVFPFYILVNAQLEVESCGKSLLKLCPDCTNARFELHFTIERPFCANPTFTQLHSLIGQLVLLKAVNANNIVLRGQFEFLQHKNALIFIGSPWFNSMDQVKANDFTLHDFAFHDPLIDLLHALKSQEINNEDLKQLLKTVSEQKADLKKANDQIRDLALFTTQNPQPLIRISLKGEVLVKNPSADALQSFTYEGKEYYNNTIWQHLAPGILNAGGNFVFETTSTGRSYVFNCRHIAGEQYINIYGRDITDEKRKEQEIKLLSLAASANNNGVIFIDEEQQIQWVNEAFETLTGYHKSHISNKGIYQFIGEIDANSAEKMELALQSKTNFAVEYKHNTQNGNLFWASVHFVFIQGQGPEKNKTWQMAIVEDISGKKQQQAEIERLSRVASANTNGVVFTTPDGRITWANDGFFKLTGFTLSEVVGQTPVQVCRGELTDLSTLEKIFDAFYNGQPFNSEIVYYKKDRSYFWGRTTCQPIKNENGAVIEYFGIIEDITEEKTQEERIKVLSQIVEDNINAVIISDKDGNIEWVNKSYVEMTGYSLEEVKGKKPGRILQGPETDPATVAYLRKQIAAGLPFNTEILNYTKTGKKYWLRIQGQPIRNTRGEVTGYFALEEDISNEKESEQKLRLVLEKLGDNVWEHDFRTGNTYFSKSDNTLLGVSLAEQSKNDELWWQSVYREDLEKLAESDRKYKNGEADSHSLEYRVRHKDGTIKWVLDRGVVIEKNKDGKPLRITGTHTDITTIKETEDELANRVKQFQSLSENIPGVLYEFEFKADGSESLRYISPALERVFGIKQEDFKNYLNYIHPDDRQRIIDKNKRCRETLEPFYDESRLIVDGKPTKWHAVHSSFSYITNDGSKIFTGFMLDITERKNTENKLEEQRKFYEDILNNIPADIAVFNAKHEYLFVNPRGMNDNELRKWIIGKRDEDYCRYRNKPMTLAAGRRETFTKVVNAKKPAEWEETLTKPDGELQYLLRRWFPVIDDNDEVSLVIGYGIDITERKKFEQALKINEEKYRGIIANMNLGLMENNPDGKISYANQSLLNMTGLSQEEIIGLDSISIVSPESSGLVELQNFKRSQGISEAYEVRVNIKGRDKWWLVSSAPKFDDQKRFVGSIVICLDINEQKELQKQLIIAREQAEQLAKTKEVFLANMSHEIRTPMNAIMGMSNQLSKTSLNEKQKFYLDTIHSAADNLLVIINDILDLSKIEAGKLSLEEISFELKQVVSNSMQVLAHKAEEKGLNLTNSFFDPRAAAVLKGDPYRLNQVLLNLISNSLKFTEKGIVDVQVTVLNTDDNSQMIQFKVIDTGIGMEANFVKQLFDKFSQEYESITRKFGGTGLGMSICKELVELMGGTIEVESEKGKGTTVKFSIGFKKGSSKDIDPINIESFATNFLDGKKILVADDNDLNRLVALTILNNYHAQIIEASNGEQAVKATEIHNPHLILMDIQMPVMNGYDATKILRRNKNQVPIIALTANAIKGEHEKCLSVGMNDYISKPFKEETFLNTIAKWLNTSLETTNTSIEVKEEKQPEPALYDLTEIISISRGNDAFVTRILKLFCDQTPGILVEMKAACARKEYQLASSLAHKIKPSIDNLKISVAMPLVRIIEKNGKENINTSEIDEQVNELEQIITQVVEKMKKQLNA